MAAGVGTLTHVQVSSCLRPSPPPCLECLAVWLNGWWLVEWLINCLAAGCQHPPRWGPNASQGDGQTIQKPTKLGPKSIEKSIKMEAKIIQNRSQEASWKGLGRSWGHLGPKMASRWPQEAPRPRKINSGAPSWEPSWKPKSIKNPSRGPEQVIVFLITCGIHFWRDLVPNWLQLGSRNLPKIEPRWNQNQCKLGCWFDNGFGRDLGTIFIEFLPEHAKGEVAKIYKNLKLTQNLMVFRYLGCSAV